MGQAQRARVCALQVVALIAHTRTGQPVLFSRPDYHIADYYHPLTFCCFCGIMKEGTLYGVADYGRLLPKCQILLTDGANCGTIMVEECTSRGRRLLSHTQTTTGGEVSSSRPSPTQTTIRMQQEQDVDY